MYYTGMSVITFGYILVILSTAENETCIFSIYTGRTEQCVCVCVSWTWVTLYLQGYNGMLEENYVTYLTSHSLPGQRFTYSSVQHTIDEWYTIASEFTIKLHTVMLDKGDMQYLYIYDRP